MYHDLQQTLQSQGVKEGFKVRLTHSPAFTAYLKVSQADHVYKSIAHAY